ncbi:CAMK/CAMK1/CAMK1-CMK protein kinase [Fusarium oxysporum f. sp. raphani 54005]|uniref:calcium/calmodulin-dependent protein kinase n=38 Tax=Fusarium TaxID=5506 RepID=A0A2K0UTV7_GIBNY|nr:CAMK/CAMK1/CAMK1-CMK protein kinase [Fusarium oxysporum f. sp. lycopersici 4287]XP_031057318.1 CAMK/CAMK1/CAMK1-CMK protein kinase [Fusarium odoratissimum NRRL 54006]EWY98505.1 CAMK/CAMK1/CAMK1-CMK protein kinase [Fusarium oxysporum NRRL 32931]EXA49871.1 CAMK/CAMK1/CAMK1-CMK protein kinase [Fusarium oxysporum f. sp. pisi HDV247]EXK41949.1 CAMK/CAMK1/CAMK1-CMK protein kinase [Fusarium oxysporum f. sp. melonis 26406]EXL00690.1 CAMK/CAMK1/CAMK1-CMK protein kinase [Fusarium oxysporum f. sp. rap
MSFAGMLNRLHGQPESYDKKAKYRFGRTLGAGTYGVVREADGPTGKVAVKIILKRNVKGNEQMVYDELEMLQKLKHPHIVKFVDWFESRDKFYIVTQLATGGELFDRICEQGKFTEKDAAETIKQILLAVDFLHKNNIVHRDLKPENLLYLSKDPDSDLVLADFGIAKMLDGKGESLKTMAGSFGYAAPEVMRKEGHGKPVDMWSMGVITYTLLCGYSPFRSENLQDLIRECTENSVVFHERYWKDVSNDAKDFILHLINPDADQRWTSEEALGHIWLTGKNATDYNLLPEIKSFRARSRFRRIIEKIKLQARIEKLKAMEEDPENSDLSAIFSEVARAKLADDKEEKEVLRVTQEVEKDAKRRSFQA